MSTAAISQIEGGIRKSPAFATILKLARAIGISMEEVALRMEGRNPKSFGDEAARISKTASIIAKAESEHERLGKTLKCAIEALATRRRP